MSCRLLCVWAAGLRKVFQLAQTIPLCSKSIRFKRILLKMHVSVFLASKRSTRRDIFGLLLCLNEQHTKIDLLHSYDIFFFCRLLYLQSLGHERSFSSLGQSPFAQNQPALKSDDYIPMSLSFWLLILQRRLCSASINLPILHDLSLFCHKNTGSEYHNFKRCLCPSEL